MSQITLIGPGKEAPPSLQVDVRQVQASDVQFDIPSKPKPAIPPRPPLQFQPPQPRSPPPPDIDADDLNDFANPNKIDSSPEEEEPQEIEQEPHEYQYEQPEYYQEEEYQEPVIQPTPPFRTLDEERQDLMFRLQRSARNGIQVRSFSWDTDIRDIRAEAARAKAEQEVDASVAFQRQILMTMCTGIEYANHRFDYLDLELDGWSESVMDDIGKFDLIFEKLHNKHAGKMSMPPELQLVFMIGGSAFTWHLVNKGRKAREAPQIPKRQRKKRSRRYESDDDYESDDSERSRLRRKYSKPKKAKRKSKKNAPDQPREMRGPGDMGGLGLGGLGGLGMMGGGLGMMTSMLPKPPMPNLQPTTTRMTDVSEQAPESSPEVEPGSSEEEAPRSESDRLSDIPSEELEQMTRDFDDLPSPSPDEGETKVIELTEVKRKPRKTAKSKKNVIVL